MHAFIEYDRSVRMTPMTGKVLSVTDKLIPEVEFFRVR